MTEQDERTIYEWAYPDRAKRQGGFRTNPYSWRKQEWDNVNCLWRDLATLDMNFAFDVCVPKLRSEGVEVQYDKRGYWWLNPIDRTTTPIVVESDFYSALVAYIKGKA